MEYAYVTFLGTSDFLPGVIVLRESLRKYNSNANLVVLTVTGIPDFVIDFLQNNLFEVIAATEIVNPYIRNEDLRKFSCMYTKLRIFDLEQYDKVIYLDADMLVCGNIEHLFRKPHMSSVVAGGFLPRNKHWVDFNAGLLVIEPSSFNFNSMLAVIKKLPSGDQGDQGFLHSYFPNWPNQPELHLDQSFNVPAEYLDEFCMVEKCHFSYINNSLSVKNIEVIHFWGPDKPWQFDLSEYSKFRGTKYYQSLQLWNDIYQGFLKEYLN